jgi:hypothetical protein
MLLKNSKLKGFCEFVKALGSGLPKCLMSDVF